MESSREFENKIFYYFQSPPPCFFLIFCISYIVSHVLILSTISIICRLQVPDAYGDDGTVPDLSIAPGARRRRLIGTSDATRNRVREILSTRAEDADMAYGTEDVFMDHEMI